LGGGYIWAQETRWKHEVRLDSDTDRFNYTDVASAEAISLTSRWNSEWTTSFMSRWYQRFGVDAQRVTARVSRTIGGHSWVSVVGGGGHDESVIPKREAGFEIGSAFRLPGRRIVRGVEVSYAQQWLWFQGSKVMVVSGSSLFYLPRDWMFTLTVAAARSSFQSPDVQWRPSGGARLGFPIRSRLRGNVNFAVGAENFAKADEIGHFSARTFGGGLRYEVTPRHNIGVAVLYQDRSQGRTQTSVGVSYGFRF
jgi:YaiO family outer membrane protein